MKKNLPLSLISLMLSLILFLALLAPNWGMAQELKTIRVGFFAFDGYHVLDENGTPSGYGYEILQHMVGYTDWKLEYVGYDQSWSEMQDLLEKGEIDLLTSAQKTPDRLERFDFSDQPLGVSTAILTTKAGNTKYAAGDYANWNGMKIGLLENNSRNQDLINFAQEHNFSYTPVYFTNLEDLVQSLKTSNQIDSILTSNLRSIDGEWILDQFASSPFYIMVQKGNVSLLTEINAVLEELYTNEPGIRTELLNKYYTPDEGLEIAFTPEERAFIAENKDWTFTAILNPDRKPFSYFVNDQPQGIISEIAQEIISRSQLNIQFIPTKNRSEYQQLIKSPEIDIRFDANYSYPEAEALGYRLTDAYLEASIVKLYKRNTKNFRSVALLKDADISNNYQNYFSTNYPEVVYYDTINEVIAAVKDGKQDLAYLYDNSAELAVQNDVTNQLVMDNMYGYQTAFAIEVDSQQNHLLFSILNKTVNSIGKQEIETIIQRYMVHTEATFSLQGLIYDNPFILVWTALAVLLIAGLLIRLFLQVRKRKQAYAQLVTEKHRNQFLADALAEAERADASKSLFLSRVSHEMRTPLNAVIGFITLAKGAEASQAKIYLANSELAAKQLLAVINDVLDMSSIESGKIKISQAPFDFKYLINSLSKIYAVQCQQKGLDFEIKLLNVVDEWLVGDQLRVNQILTNLLGNAVKFTEQGYIQLKISQTIPSSPEQVFIHFEISDSGCGITEEMKNRLFKPFEQESSLTAQKYGGNGLGLSIVKNLVNMMEGAIKVDSQPGEGTTFRVDLPFIRSEAEAKLQLSEGIKSLRVLAVDDEISERNYISAVLERMEIRHTCVENGRAALQAIEASYKEQDQYNICLLDWRLPEMDGLEIAQQIRHKYAQKLIIILISAYELQDGNIQAKKAGADLFVSKPLFQSSLFDLFMMLTGGKLTKQDALITEQNFKGKRILLAEDNLMNRMVAIGLIEKLGIECDWVEDGQIAVDKFLASPANYYEVILMDIQMPNLNGLEATQIIRNSQHPQAQSIQILALTANAFNEDIAKALACGMNDHIAKPIQVEILVEALKKAFQS